MLETAVKTALVLLLAAFAARAGAESGVFEVIHFWNAPSEREAFQVISDEFRRRNEVKWIEQVLPSSDTVREQALQRIVNGHPPDAVLWHPSSEVWNLHDMRVIHSLTPLAGELRLGNRLPAPVRDAVVHAGEYVALPTNLHAENLAWYSTGLYKKLGLEHPQTWEQLLEQARIMQDAGLPALAVGAQDWEKRTVFLTILASLNRQTYIRLLERGEPALSAAPEVIRTFEIMAALRETSRTAAEPNNWSEAAALVAAGKAGVQFMGDWVAQELKSRGWAPGVDYQCRPPPGRQPAFIVVVDGFIFPVTGRGGGLYRKFAETVLDPEVQAEFALKKGALPAVKGVSGEKFDDCSRLVLEAMQNESALAPSPATFTASNFVVIVQSIAARFWNSQMSPGRAVELLRDELLTARQLEQTP